MRKEFDELYFFITVLYRSRWPFATDALGFHLMSRRDSG